MSLLPLTVVGVFATASAFVSAHDSALQAIDDKLRNAVLLWHTRVDALTAQARVVAQDNLVILNLDLGLYQPFHEYLASVRARDGGDLALVLDPQGRLLASAGQEYVPLGEPLFPASVLGDPAAGGALRVVQLAGSPLLAAENIELADPRRDVTLLAVQPIYNYAQVHVGWAVNGLVIGRRVESGTTAFPDDIRTQIGIPVLLAESGRLLYSSDPEAGIRLPDAWELHATNPSAELVRLSGAHDVHLARFTPVAADSTVMIGVAYSESAYLAGRNVLLGVLAIVLALTVGAAAWAGLALSGAMAEPIAAVARGAREIVNGNYEVRIQVAAEDEIGLMAEEFSVMASKLSETIGELNREMAEHQEAELQVRQLNEELEERVADRTRELTDANEALAESLSTLRRTQKHLVEAEKHASLGNLVAGMAHELNTPIGISLTASSFIESRTKEFSAVVDSGKVSRRELDQYMSEVVQAVNLLTANLGRTAEQIRFFKQIAVDQESGTRAAIDLRQFVDELCLGLQHQLAAEHHRFTNSIPHGILLLTWPNELYQVLSQFIANSRQHAFEGRTGGTMEFSAEREDGHVLMHFRDDGSGMDESVRKRVFDPFYTTKRGTGRTGLGLSIVYNLVTARLGGEIRCESALGEGTTFSIRLPVGADLPADPS